MGGKGLDRRERNQTPNGSSHKQIVSVDNIWFFKLLTVTAGTRKVKKKQKAIRKKGRGGGGLVDGASAGSEQKSI